MGARSRGPAAGAGPQRTVETSSIGGREVSLPAGRAFVVQLDAAADPARSLVLGRIEHVSSGRAAYFRSIEELTAFLASELPRGNF